MPRPSVFDDMTPEALRAFSSEFERRHFKNMDAMVDWLGERGFEVSRSAVGRKAVVLKADFKRNLDMVKTATLGAEMIAQTTADDNGKIADGLITLVQGGLFDVMSNLSSVSDSDDPEERLKLLIGAARAAADVGRASVATKKLRQEMESSVRKKCAEELTTELKNDGISAELEASIKRILLGK